jgi:hypothetical protein
MSTCDKFVNKRLWKSHSSTNYAHVVVVYGGVGNNVDNVDNADVEYDLKVLLLSTVVCGRYLLTISITGSDPIPMSLRSIFGYVQDIDALALQAHLWSATLGPHPYLDLNGSHLGVGSKYDPRVFLNLPPCCIQLG